MIKTSNWWCSDGTYNLKDNDVYGTQGANGVSNLGNESHYKAGAESKLIKSAASGDRRNELMYAACRQRRQICGPNHIEENDTEANRKRVVLGAEPGMNSSEKCTWIMRSKTKAPTFVISNARAGK